MQRPLSALLLLLLLPVAQETLLLLLLGARLPTKLPEAVLVQKPAPRSL